IAWAAVAVAGAVAVAAGFLPSAAVRIDCFVRFALPVVASAIVLAIVAGAISIARWSRAGGRIAVMDALAALVLAAVIGAIALVVPGKMRIQADEYMVAAASVGIWSRQSPEVV